MIERKVTKMGERRIQYEKKKTMKQRSLARNLWGHSQGHKVNNLDIPKDAPPLKERTCEDQVSQCITGNYKVSLGK